CGGQCDDGGADGGEARWSHVPPVAPPRLLVVSWDISPHWQIETNLDRTSEVEVRFIAENPHRTRVELEHRNLDRHGEGWQEEREAVNGEGGWPLYLQRFGDLLKG